MWESYLIETVENGVNQSWIMPRELTDGLRIFLKMVLRAVSSSQLEMAFEKGWKRSILLTQIKIIEQCDFCLFQIYFLNIKYLGVIALSQRHVKSIRDIRLSTISWSQKGKHGMNSLIWQTKSSTIHRDRKPNGGCQGLGEGKMVP